MVYYIYVNYWINSFPQVTKWISLLISVHSYADILWCGCRWFIRTIQFRWGWWWRLSSGAHLFIWIDYWQVRNCSEGIIMFSSWLLAIRRARIRWECLVSFHDSHSELARFNISGSMMGIIIQACAFKSCVVYENLCNDIPNKTNAQCIPRSGLLGK